MKKMMKRILSLLLCLVMVLGLLPAMTPVAEAVSPTSWSELVAYLTDPEFQSIFLENDISYVAGENEDPTVTIVGKKFLNLNGHELIVDDDSNAVDGASRPLGSEQLDRTLFTIPAGASLEVIDQPAYVDSGKGKIHYDGYMADANKAYHACWRNLFDVSGTLLIHNGIFEAGRTLKQWYPMVNNFTQQIFGKVINARAGSTVIIHDGNFTGHGYVPKSSFANCNTEELRSAVIDFPSEGRATVYINGGNFYARGGANVFGTYERPVYGEDYTGSAYSVLEVMGGYFEVEDLGDIRVESPGLPYDASGNGGRLGIQARNLHEDLSLVQLAFHYKDDNVISGGYEQADQIDATHLHTRLYAGYEVESVAISPWPEMRGVWHELNIQQTLYGETVEPEYLYGHRKITMQSYYNLVYGESDPNSVTLSWDADDLEDAQYYFYNDGSGLSSDPTVKYRWDIYKERTQYRVEYKVNSTDQDPDYVIYTDEPSLSLQNAVCNGELIDWNESFWWVIEPYVEETHPYGNVAVRNDAYIFIYMDYLRVEDLKIQINDVPQLTDKDVYYVDLGDKIRLDYRRLELHPDLADEYYLFQLVYLRYMDGEFAGCQAPPWVSYIDESMTLVIDNSILPLSSAPKQPEKNTMEFVFSTAESEPEELTGSSIVYANSVTVDNSITLGITPAGSLLHKLAMLQNSPVQYQWQVSQDGTTGWTDLEGATMGSGFVPSAYGVEVGDYIRVKAIALRYKGEICSNAAQVGGNMNAAQAPTPRVKIVNGKTAVIENYDPTMEYVWSTNSVNKAEEFEAAEPIEEDRFDPPAYGFYYVAGRYKATETASAGTHMPCVGFSFSAGTGTDIRPTYLRYPDLGTSSGVAQKVYVKKGSIEHVNYCYDPVEANFGLASFISNDTKIVKIADVTPSKISIRGMEPGVTRILPAEKSTDLTDTWTDGQRSAQDLYVVVYDPADPATNVLQDTRYGDYTLRVGDSYTPKNPKDAGYTYAPTKEVEKKFDNFRWYLRESSLTNSWLTTENEYAVIDTVTGKVTAKAVTPANGIQIEVFAFKDGEVPTDNDYNDKGGRVGWYRLKVVDSERITLEGVRIVPESLSLEVGETYQLKAVPSPLNASVTTTSWTRTGMAISLKDGLVTALKPGQSNVTVKLIGAGAPAPNGVTYTIPVIVYSADHAHVVEEWNYNEQQRWGTCSTCGEDIYEECDYQVFEVNDVGGCDGKITTTMQCQTCKHTYSYVTKKSHEYGVYSYNEVNHWQNCLVCNERKNKDDYYQGKYKHSYADREFCSVCGYKRGSDVGGMGASDEPMVDGSYAVSGTTATVTPVVSNLADDFIVTVMVAQYSSTGQMKDMQMISHTGNGPVSVPETFTHASGDVYKAFLVLPGTYEWAPWVPMSEAKLLTEGVG